MLFKEVGNIAVVAFNFAHIFDSIDIANEVFDIAYELHLNSWNGREKLELRLLELRDVKFVFYFFPKSISV